MTSEIHVLNLPIYKDRHKTPRHWLSPRFDSQHVACIRFNLILYFTLRLINEMWHSMTESLIPPPVAHTISLRLRQVPYKVTEELQSHGGEGSIRERRYFSQKSLEPETSNPTRNPSHYITKLPFEILYAKVKSFPFHFLKTEEKKSLSKGRKYSSHNYSLDSAEFCRNIRPLVCRYVISHDYLEDPVKLKNEMVELLGTEIIAFMLDCFA